MNIKTQIIDTSKRCKDKFNNMIENNPEIINSNPIDDGWIVKIKISNKNEFSDLLTLNEYQKIINV